MIATNYTDLRENLKKYCDLAVEDFEAIIITRKKNENVVLISEAEYNNIKENEYIRSNKKNYNKLLKSIKELENGQGEEHELIHSDEE